LRIGVARGKELVPVDRANGDAEGEITRLNNTCNIGHFQSRYPGAHRRGFPRIRRAAFTRPTER